MTPGTEQPALDDDAILKGLEPLAAAMGMPADGLLALIRAEAAEHQQAAAGTPEGGYFATIAFMGRIEYTGYVTQITKHGQAAYHIDLPEKLWGGNPLAWMEHAASAWFSERPATEAYVRKTWEEKVQEAARRAREEAAWRREREQRALESGSGGPPCTCHEGDADCEVHAW